MQLLVPADSENGGFFARIHCFLVCLLFVLIGSVHVSGKCYSGVDGIVASCERHIVLKLGSPLFLQSCRLHTVAGSLQGSLGTDYRVTLEVQGSWSMEIRSRYETLSYTRNALQINMGNLVRTFTYLKQATLF